MTNPLPQLRLAAIKARCGAEDYTDGRKLTLSGPELDAMYKQLKHARQDIPALVAEVEQLKRTISSVLTYFQTEAFMECSVAEHCEKLLTKTLGQ